MVPTATSFLTTKVRTPHFCMHQRMHSCPLQHLNTPSGKGLICSSTDSTAAIGTLLGVQIYWKPTKVYVDSSTSP